MARAVAQHTKQEMDAARARWKRLAALKGNIAKCKTVLRTLPTMSWPWYQHGFRDDSTEFSLRRRSSLSIYGGPGRTRPETPVKISPQGKARLMPGTTILV
ncbi:hypothetical protein ElyMa_000251700 [Elysia marginata]|uniref:Uncharacterized protein n=1 Tax=Elysia marginata TaxID=1093978 RepID=A0AAV4F4I7_9GAST|nr:hypothetical protein ElyMa_000251700 [Elysia marginata]